MMMVCQHAKKRTRAGVKGRQLAKTLQWLWPTCTVSLYMRFCHFLPYLPFQPCRKHSQTHMDTVFMVTQSTEIL